VQTVLLVCEQCVASFFPAYLQNPESSQLPPINSYEGGITSNCKQPYFVLTVVQYQTSYLPNRPPHTNKGNGARVKTKGHFGNYWRGSSQQPSEDYCRLSTTLRPLCFELNYTTKGKFSYVRDVSTAGQGTAVQP
jgi:hypothetical protein